ncbi:hypothetical protein FRB98_004695 [Tulasnella sp. 332]|nr:hypothetical protein FRB98_004695 [Tulasnella sp. 332]
MLGQIQWRVTSLFRKYHHLTSPQATKRQLLIGHRWLDIFTAAGAGDIRWQKVLSRYSTMIEAKRAKERSQTKLEEELVWQEKLRNRPIMTGGLMRPSVLNPPLPRLKPQPIHITMMMRRRRDVRENRFVRARVNTEWKQDLLAERSFEAMLEEPSSSSKDPKSESVYEDRGWDEALDSYGYAMKQSAQREENRARMKFTPELLEMVKQARHEKIINKTKEKERERQGEVLNKTRARMRQGLPAHLISTVGKKGVERDKFIKSPSEGGYAGMVKRRAGMKIKNDTSAKEDGVSPVGIRVGEEIRSENLRRMERGT